MAGADRPSVSVSRSATIPTISTEREGAVDGCATRSVCPSADTPPPASTDASDSLMTASPCPAAGPNPRPATSVAPNASNHPGVTTPPAITRRISSVSDGCQYRTAPFILTKSAKPAAEIDGAPPSLSSTPSTNGRASR